MKWKEPILESFENTDTSGRCYVGSGASVGATSTSCGSGSSHGGSNATCHFGGSAGNSGQCFNGSSPGASCGAGGGI